IIMNISDVNNRRKLELQANALNVLRGLVGQFQRPEQYIREIVQNSLDADCSEVRINFDYDDSKSLAEIIMSDDGCGMSFQDTREYLLNLFNSKKYQDFSKIGRFGIGFVSLFAVHPDLVLVETTKNSKTHTVILDSPENGGGSRTIEHDKPNDSSGTIIRLRKNISLDDLALIKDGIKSELLESCCYVKKPVYFEDERINKEFEIPEAIVNARIGGKGIEGWVGLVPEGEELYQLFNNRLLITKGDKLFDEGCENLSFMVSSRYLSPNLSRDALLDDTKYSFVMKAIRRETNTIGEKVFEELERRVTSKAIVLPSYEYISSWSQHSGKDMELLWEYARRHLLTKIAEISKKSETNSFKKNQKVFEKLPETLLNYKLFPGMDGEYASLKDVLKVVDKYGKIYTSKRKNLLTDALLKKGYKILLPMPWYIEDKCPGALLRTIAPNEDVNHDFTLPVEISKEILSEDQINFLETARQYFKKTPLTKHFSQIYFGNFEEQIGEKQNRPYIVPNHYEMTSMGYGRKNITAKEKRSMSKSVTDFVSDKRKFILNITHNYTNALIKQSKDSFDWPVAYWNLFQIMSTELTHNYPNIISKVQRTYFSSLAKNGGEKKNERNKSKK
ncbi:MAG: ATP-binding protein, partial [Nanoarchaeota archaeon]|nr:ATP-binding protein [Nanoarchaeota archaeon]